MGFLRPLWAYRGFIVGSVRREFQAKYRNSVLGAAWMVLNPLAMILVYTVIFSEVMRAKLPGVDSKFAYSIYLCAGVLVWGLFAEITGRAQAVFLEQANLLKKVSFPRLCLPTVVVANALLNFSIVFGLFTVFLLASGSFPGLVFVALVPVLALIVLFAIGLGIALGVLNVFFRDVGQAFGILLQFWFWLTPVVYTASIVPERLRPLLYLNPMTAPIAACQDILVAGQWPRWHSLWPLAVLAVVVCMLGLRLFRRHAGEMVDEL
ncbi:MAG: ABC transporter permease [Pseudomonadota bacterium]